MSFILALDVVPLDGTPAPAVVYQATSLFNFADPTVIMLWFTLTMDIVLLAWVLYGIYRDMKGIRLLKKSGHMVKLIRMPAPVINDQQIIDPKTKEVYRVDPEAEPLFTEGPLGVMIPVIAVIEGLGSTVPLFKDKRDPAVKYLDEKTLYVGQEATAEKESNTIRIEKDKWGWIMPLIAGAGIMAMMGVAFGWLK